MFDKIAPKEDAPSLPVDELRDRFASSHMLAFDMFHISSVSGNRTWISFKLKAAGTLRKAAA